MISILKKYWLKFTLVIFLVIISVNYGLSYVVEKKVNQIIAQNPHSKYTGEIKQLKFNLIRRGLTLKNITLTPRAKAFDALDKGNDSITQLENIHVKRVDVSGFNIYRFLVKNEIEVDLFKADHIQFQHFINKTKENTPLEKEHDRLTFNGLDKIQVNHIILNQIDTEIIDLDQNNIAAHLSLNKLDLGGLSISKENGFLVQMLDDVYTSKDLNISLHQKFYTITLQEAKINTKNDNISLTALAYKPAESYDTLGQKFKYSKTFPTLEIQSIDVFNCDINPILKQQHLYADSIAINTLNVDLFKDKNKPNNTQLRKTFFYQKLKKLDFPVHVKQVSIIDGNLNLEHRLKEKDLLFKFALSDIQIKAKNITSIDSLRTKPLTLNLLARANKNAQLNASFTFNLKDNQDYFSYNGNLGASPFKLYDSAIFPVLGLKLINGDLDNLSFKGHGNPNEIKGQMTLLYHNLEAEVYKGHSLEEFELASWAVNSVLHASNPNKKGVTRQVEMFALRDYHKGLSNLLWQGLQSGLINTLSPIGKISEEKVKRKKRRKEKKHN